MTHIIWLCIVACTALWLQSLFAYLGVSIDLGPISFHASSFQGHVAFFVGDQLDFRSGFVMHTGYGGPLYPPPPTQQAGLICQLTTGSYGVAVFNRVNLAFVNAGNPVTVTGFVAPHWLPLTASVAFAAGLPLMIKWRRYASGRCSACGYDLRGNRSACPECGRFDK